ncbi:hypothetical protein CHH53_04125 [Terribacillus sp. 7520-G]|nr:hypothetical protein CHH53_04125 [Terribacillus sp. 7520-G]
MCIGIGIIVAGIIIGAFMADDLLDFQWSIFLTWFLASFVSGFIFIGFVEIINILHKIEK